jgi:ABC-type sugar transport system ATPase subunit
MEQTATKHKEDTMTREPMLRVHQLVKRFGGLTAVNKVDMEVYPGEIVGLVGDNAAGKSTLIKCISGVYQPDEGEIYFQGKRVHFSLPLEARNAHIETIYQDLALAGNLTVSANIFMGREVRKRYLGGLVQVLDEDVMLGESQKVMDRLKIHIPDFNQQIETLSGGQRQAVAIARAVYWKAQLMIMDEPTNNLGVVEQRKVLELVQELREQGVPIILISHTLPDIFAVTDRIVVLHRGHKVTEKKTSETDSQEIVQYMVGALDDNRVEEAEIHN